MGQTATQSLYDLLDDSQKNQLSAITSRIESAGPGSLNSKIGEQAIDILESWLMDEEQKLNLSSNAWDIFFSLCGVRHA